MGPALVCSGPLRALRSLAALYDMPAVRVQAEIAGAAEEAGADLRDPFAALPARLAARLGQEAAVPERIHYFHATRVTDPGSFLTDGIRPLGAVLDALWRQLRAFAQQIDDRDWEELRSDADRGAIGPDTYRRRVPHVLHHGPHAQLVLDGLLEPERYGARDHLDAPEIVADICSAATDRFGIDLLTRYRRASVPCVVEAALGPDQVDGAVAACCWYVSAALRGERSASSAWRHDGAGRGVPARAIVSIRATDGSGREWSRSPSSTQRRNGH